MPKLRPIWPGKSASTPTCGSSRPKTAPGDTSSIGSCIDGLALDALGQRAKPRTQARPHPTLPRVRGKVGWRAQRIGLAICRIGSRLRDRIVAFCLRSPLGKETARRAAIETVIEVREVVDALHRIARRSAHQQQDALEYRDRHAGCLGSDHHGFPRRIVEYAFAQTVRNVDQPLEFAGELADPALQRSRIDLPIAARAVCGGCVDVIAAA